MITSKEEILKASRELIRQKGWEAVNIRAVAAACGVSVGAIYYYFDSKAELTGAAVASIWQEIFHLPDDVPPPADTKTCILWICERIKEGNEKYPGFFTLHSLGFLGEEKKSALVPPRFGEPSESGDSSVKARDRSRRDETDCSAEFCARPDSRP